MKCERCGSSPKNPMELTDYCAECGRNLCQKCMEKGCCKHVPAKSGMEADEYYEKTYGRDKEGLSVVDSQ